MITLLAIPVAIIVSTMASTVTSRPVRSEVGSPVGLRSGDAPAPGIATLDTALGSDDPNSRCVTRRGAWSAIPFKHVNLGPDVARSGIEDALWGPRWRAVVTDSAQWPAVWRAATDPSFSPDTVRLRDGRDSVVSRSVPTPPISFGHDAIVFAATRTYNPGPTALQVTSIRRCRKTRAVVVRTLETTVISRTESTGRAFTAVRVRRRALEGASVVFVDRERFVTGR